MITFEGREIKEFILIEVKEKEYSVEVSTHLVNVSTLGVMAAHNALGSEIKEGIKEAIAEMGR